MRKMLVSLTFVMVLSGLVLAATFQGLTDRIEMNRELALASSLAAIFPGEPNARFEEIATGDSSLPTIYEGQRANGVTLGYAVRVETQGYGGTITMLVGVDGNLGSVLGIEIVEHVETPGLGGNITERSFKDQFAGLVTSEDLAFVKNIEPDPLANEVQAISGATITSRAIVTGINSGLAVALPAIEEHAE